MGWMHLQPLLVFISALAETKSNLNFHTEAAAALPHFTLDGKPPGQLVLCAQDLVAHGCWIIPLAAGHDFSHWEGEKQGGSATGAAPWFVTWL